MIKIGSKALLRLFVSRSLRSFNQKCKQETSLNNSNAPIKSCTRSWRHERLNSFPSFIYVQKYSQMFLENLGIMRGDLPYFKFLCRPFTNRGRWHFQFTPPYSTFRSRGSICQIIVPFSCTTHVCYWRSTVCLFSGEGRGGGENKIT